LESRNLLTSDLCPPTSTLRPPSDSNRRAGGKEIRRFLFGNCSGGLRRRAADFDYCCEASHLAAIASSRSIIVNVGANQTEIPAIVEVADDLTSQSRHSLLLQGSPPSGKLLIPLNRRDVRVVEGARLEINSRRAC
jgi:hypothetical protein